MEKSQNTFALITGASKGLGKAIAVELAKKGYNILLVARSENELIGLAKNLSQTYNITAKYLATDLSLENAPSAIHLWVRENNFAISVLVNNAGYGLWGKFVGLPLSQQLEMCRLNMDCVISLCHLLLPDMLKLNNAYILNVASTAAYQAVPTLAIYSATKSFILSFSRAIRFELKGTNVSVSCLSPGPIDTGFAHRAGLDAFSKMAEKFNMQPDEVAKIAVKAMFSKKSEIIPGFTNLISVFANRILPKNLIEKTAAGLYKI